MLKPIFDERPVFLIGGGESLRDFDWSRLSRRQTVALNLAYRTVPWADVLFFSDSRFWNAHRDPHGKHFWKAPDLYRVISSVPATADASGRIEHVPASSLTVRSGRKWQSVENMNTGAQAIGLARQLGAKKIVLLGFDNTPGHWATGKPYAHPRQPDPSVFERYSADFKKIARLKLDIVHATADGEPTSTLDCFETVSFSDVF